MVRRGDGAIVASSFYTLFTSLHQHVLNKKLKEALSLCRIAQVMIKDELLQIAEYSKTGHEMF